MPKCYLYFCGLCLRPWSTYSEAGRRVFYSNKLCEDYMRHSIKSKFTSQFRTVVGLIVFCIIMCLELVAEEGIRAETERKLDILSFVGILLLRKERNKIGG